MLRIFLRSFDFYLLKNFILKFIQKINSLNINYSGPVSLPTRRTRFNILRSPHGDKNSRDQFEIALYKKLIDLFCDTKYIVDFKNFFTTYNFEFRIKVFL